MQSADVVGLVPAAGKGERLGLPFPKELWPLIGKEEFYPVARRTVENLTTAGVRHIVVVTNANKPSVMQYLGNGSRFGAHIAYVCQEQFQNRGMSPGLSDALDCGYHLIRDKIVAFGMPDTIVEPVECFQPLLQAVREGADLALGLFPTAKPHKFGMVQCDERGAIERVVDKPAQTDLRLMWGVMAWSPRFTEHLHHVMTTEPTDFAGVMNGALRQGLRGTGIEIRDGRYLDLGTYDDLVRLGTFLAP